MFRSLMTIIRELYLYLNEVIFMLKHWVKLRRYINSVMWQHAVERHVCCVQCRLVPHCTQHTCRYDLLPHHLIYITTQFYRVF